MKKLLLLLLCATSLQAQDTVRVKHSNYETVFSKSKKYPVLVEWWVTKAKVLCAKPVARKDKFIPDPLLKEESDVAIYYVGSGFDRGHLSPAADNRCGSDMVMEESFYFTNMAPQYPGLNRGQWKALEEYARQLAETQDSIFVQAGCTGEIKKLQKLSVPSHCWKIITIKKTGKILPFVFPNVSEKGIDYMNNLVSLDSIKKLRK